VAFVGTVKTASGATAVQIEWSWRRGSRSIEHLGSAHDEVELAALKTAAAARLTTGQTELGLGLTAAVEPGTLPITPSPMSHLRVALCAAYRVLGFESATKDDNVSRDLASSRIIEPTSKVDASRVLTEVGAKSFRMFKHDLQARPIYHHKRESIDAHLRTVFAALAVTHWIEHQTGWSIKKFVRTARRYRTVTIQAGRQTLTAAEPLPDDLADVLTKIRGSGAH